MPNLGNAWHIPNSPEPRGRGGMRDPIGALVPGMDVTIFSGNQFQGGGNFGNQLQTGSSVFFKRVADANWTELPMKFRRTAGNNKYYSATIPANTSSAFQAGDVVQYYLRIAYDDHDTTFLHANASGDASTATENEATAQAASFTFTLQSSALKGKWEPVFEFPNVAIHTHVLRNGRVLMWGRRDRPDQSLDIHECTPFVWDPKDPLISPNPTNPPTAKTTNTPQPKRKDDTDDTKETTVNLFCSGHTFLPDGRLLVVGGHNADSDGLNQAVIYTPASPSSNDPGTWSPTAPMGQGDTMRRWYPTATTLPDGSVLVLSGSYIDTTQPKGKQTIIVDLLQVWENDKWKTIKKGDGGDLNFFGLPLYPRMHVASDGRVFMSGTNAGTFLLKTSQPGGWTGVGPRANGNRDYCPAVMYDRDKIIYIGGGNDPAPPGNQNDPRPPTAEVEIIDLSENPPRWRATQSMTFRRRQHNAVILPDGTVLVTGGTRGGDGDKPANGTPGFNDLRPGQPVHVAELWDPKGNGGSGAWTELAAEEVDRCYHATAVLLPDARVLSAGGGEYRPDDLNTNAPEDSHREAQIFSPPYLFKGPRPVITSAPASVNYEDSFQVGTSQPNDIGRVSWVRLPSVTHSFDQNQRINFLDFAVGTGTLNVTAPNSPDVCPPGHYMLFILSKAGVPSEAKIIQIQALAAPAVLTAASIATATATVADQPPSTPSPAGSEPRAYSQVYARQAAVAEAAKGTAVVIGITGTCPYGIGSCWGGAYHALRRLEGVDLVDPIPNTDDSTAEVFLEDERLPALDRWDKQFRSIVNGTYELRGVEVTVQGVTEKREEKLFLAGSGQRQEVQLVPLATDKIQRNRAAGAPNLPEESEVRAYDDLAVRDLADGQQITVTGPLKQTDAGYQLHVRLWDV
jgi:galactose oxidase